MKKYLKILLLIFIVWGCKKSVFNDPVLTSISKQYPLFEFNRPVLIDTIHNDIYNNRGPEAVSYYYRDTLENGKTAAMCVFKTPDNVSYLYYYAQMWEKDGWGYVLKIAEDTLYLYKSRRTDVVFLVGEYEFRRWGATMQHPGLDSLERIYYDLHRDSLRRLKGNNLPPLPKPTPEEIERWKKMGMRY